MPKTRRPLALGSALIATLACLLLAAGAAVARGPTASVSLGDSFISGQAGRWQGNSTDALGSRAGTDRACVATPFGCRYEKGRVYLGGTAPPGCARSDVAEILSAQVGVRTEINIACSGAQTSQIFRGSNGGRRFKGEAPQADQLARIAKDHTVRLITLSIGGNDIGFADTVVACVAAYATRARPCAARMQAAIDAKLPKAMAGVAKAIGEIRSVMRSAGYRPWDYRLVLQSYPSPVPRASENRYPEIGVGRAFVGGCPFYDSDLDASRDKLVPLLDDNLRAIALATGTQFLSLKDAFQGRETCARTAQLADRANPPSPARSEWTRAIGIGPILQGEGIDEEAHPNAYGQQALGRCLTLLSSRRTGSWGCRNTPGKGTDSMVLSRVSPLPERFRMRLRVSPRRVVAGRRSCLRIRVLSSGQPVEGVTVQLGRSRGRSSSDGRLRRCVRLRARRYRVRARRQDFRPVSVIVTARPPRR
ncbi:MAG TPA: GDSL-type esterase/lipase family protein [Thermoleophilaceae bacterium]|nr:GDSL-type esterase/lipase family protein [Thermoleophilaceae bacterium]